MVLAANYLLHHLLQVPQVHHPLDQDRAPAQSTQPPIQEQRRQQKMIYVLDNHSRLDKIL